MINSDSMSPTQSFKRIWKNYGKEHLFSFIIANLFMILIAGTTALYPIVIDYAFLSLEEANWSKIIFIPVFIILLTFIKGAALYKQTVIINTLVQTIIFKIQSSLFNSLLKLDLDVINAIRVGNLQARIMNDVNLMKEALIRSFNNLVRDLFTLIGLIISMFWLNWTLALAVIIVYPLAVFPIVKIGKRSRSLSNLMQEHIGKSSAFVTESFSGIRLIKSYQLEDVQNKKANTYFEELKKIIIKVISTRAGLEPVMEIIGGIAISLVILLAGWQIVSGTSTVGEFSGFISALLIAVGPARALGTLNSVLQEGTAAANRVFGGIDSRSKVIDDGNAEEIKTFKGNISFKNIIYNYSDKNIAALDNINLEIVAGETIAVVGPSGSGKSTLVNLLLRFFDPYSGDVLIDGKNLKNIKISSLRKNIAIVSQDTLLFHGTVSDNIAFGNQNAKQLDIESSAKEAEADNFIKLLPDGYETMIGENGANLSGGERQRIAIARAILRDPAILILDEPTSSLDSEAEDKIKQTLSSISKNRTTIIIAHRLSTVTNSNRIIVLDKGKISAIGNHDELLEKSSLYKKLALLQNIE
ncbi:MAG: ABC transporter ATP-binding protein [Alphaproteobacteria bacterium]|nr:ABC transporter ATP-binding protein [Alphaproteobacteria bacterium]